MSSIPNKFDDTYYDIGYYTKKGKTFRRTDKTLEQWGYDNPTGEWEGCKPITEAWAIMFNPEKMLDVGCGRGTFIAYARQFGIEAEGFDFSEWAVEHPYSDCDAKWIIRHDAKKPWPYKDKSFDFVIALDFFEHLYELDIKEVADELFRVGSKWIFLQIATVDGVKEKGYILKEGTPTPIELEVYAAAGHVTVQTEAYWLPKLERAGWKLRPDLTKQFFGMVDPAVVKNWLTNTILVYERTE